MHGPARLALVVIASIAFVAGDAPAWAKVPPFTVEVAGGAPTRGHPVVVVVRLWSDAEHTQAAPAWPSLHSAIWAYPLRDDGTVVPQAGVRLDPIRQDRVRMVDRFVPMRAGAWVLMPFTPPYELVGAPSVEEASDHGWSGPVRFWVRGAPGRGSRPGPSAIPERVRMPWLRIVLAASFVGASVAATRRARSSRAPADRAR